YEAELNEFLERFFDFDDQRSAGHGADDVIRQSPAELFGDFVAESFRSLRIVRTQINVHEAPVMLVSNLRAEAVHLIIAAGYADQFGAENLGAEDFGLL